MVNIEIDGKIYSVPEGDNLLQACLSLGLDLPYFCWHPAMGSVGACRQCALIQYEDNANPESGKPSEQRGRIVMGCMTPVSEGMRIAINDSRAKVFRAQVIEYLMTNHPHDCPVCEEGGECHLQDMTLMSGHTERRYQGKKRTYRNQYLGPFINHEMNRCIACYRCQRYYQDYAGGHDLQVMAAHNHVYFGRHEDGVLESEFSGNLVEVCPTGVFTDKTLSQHYSRKWDLQAAPSICVHCALGCNTSPGERYGELRRIVNRYHGEVNGYFLCDRGRFGYDFVNSPERIRHARRIQVNDQGERLETELTRRETRDWLLALIGQGKRLLGVGSPRASLEANFALRELVGSENFCSGLNAQEAALYQLTRQILLAYPVRIPSLKQIEQADAVLVLGEDVLNTSPRLALSLRQTAANIGKSISEKLRVPLWQDAAIRGARQDRKTPIFLATLSATGIDDIAAETFHASPDRLARLGGAIAHVLDTEAPAVDGLSEREQALAERIAETLGQASNPLVVSGSGSYSVAVLKAAANIAKALAGKADTKVADLYLCLPECNSLGLALLYENEPVCSLQRAIESAEAGEVDTLVVLENDLSRHASRDELARLYDSSLQMVVMDHLCQVSSSRAHLMLPSATFAESEGTLVSSEGRAQRYFAVYLPGDDCRASWEWLSDMIALRENLKAPRWQCFDEVTRSCAESIPGLQGMIGAAPDEAFRIDGQKINRQPHRYSGRTAMHANVTVSEPRQPEDADSALGFTMEGYAVAEPGERPAALTPYYWSPGWNSNQSVGKFQQEINGPLQGGDPGVRLLLPSNSASEPWFELAPDEPTLDNGEWLITPQHLIFASEELSAQSPPVAARSPVACVLLNPDAAAKLSVTGGDGVVIACADRMLNLEVAIDSSLPANCVAVPVGLQETAGLAYLRAVSVARDPDWQRRPEADVFATTKAGGQP